MELLPEDWKNVFALETPLLELVARGSILYFTIITFIRFMPRRTGGEIATMDLVFLFLIADAAAHALGDYRAVTDAIILIATLMAWNYLLNFLSFRIPRLERVISPPPLQVIRNGRLLWRNMRREFLTQQELMEHLREEGVDNLDSVKAAFVESDGKLSVVCR